MKKKNLRQILIPAFIITACIPIAIFTVISQARLKKSTGRSSEVKSVSEYDIG